MRRGRKRKHQSWSLENFDDGYISQGRFKIRSPDHPRADREGRILRSIIAYEAYHGVEVPRDMIIHHIDGDTLNDSKENLEVKPLRGPESHASHHHSGENHPLWKGDDALPYTTYIRALKSRKQATAEGCLTPEIEAEWRRACDERNKFRREGGELKKH